MAKRKNKHTHKYNFPQNTAEKTKDGAPRIQQKQCVKLMCLGSVSSSSLTSETRRGSQVKDQVISEIR